MILHVTLYFALIVKRRVSCQSASVLIHSMQSIMAISGSIQSHLLRMLFDEEWVIGVRRSAVSNLPREGIDGCALLEPPIGSHYADPFVISEGGVIYTFFEAWGGHTHKGVISFAMIDYRGRWSAPQVALERPYHLSYPFVFKWRDEFYMLPETCQNHTIELYHATKFPATWELSSVLMKNVDAVDSTLFEEDGRWWMFTTGMGDSIARFRHLLVFHACSPYGPWQPHPLNPVVDDLSSARGAGQLFVDNGQLIRPGQDCRYRYGHAITWNRIDVLTDYEYLETRVATLRPKLIEGWLATHTFNQVGEWQVFDGKRITGRLR